MHFTPSLLDLQFVLLLCALGFVRAIWPAQHYVVLGALGSALLIGFASPKTLAVISAISLCYLYPLHRLMRVAQIRQWPKACQRLLLWTGIGGLIAFLLLFKVYRHFTVPWLGGPWLRADILALIGFSYFIFRAINFLYIQSIAPVDEKYPWGILYYTLFPPTLSSGPIQRYQDFKRQLTNPAPISAALLRAAGYRITRGYFRKIVLAFLLNEAVLTMLAGEITFVNSVMIIVLFYLYFYYDFAGYSDIAIGYGLLMGITVPENFKKPFLATTVSEFWRNWHITLADWFRDHIFIPLGGMQGTKLRAAILAFFIMILCGFWHGLSLCLFIWGVWHGTLLATEAVLGTKPIPPALRHGPKYWFRVLWTNARVALPCILFLPDPQILQVLRGLWSLRIL
jgi:alginate O-acetyltransferase complex protein AlgI